MSPATTWQRKPGALPGSIALAQAPERGALTPAHERFWRRARRRLGDPAGTRTPIERQALRRFDRPAPCLTVYDGLLAGGER